MASYEVIGLARTISTSDRTSERVVLAGVETRSGDGIALEDSLAELAALSASAGAEVAGAITQKLRHIDPRTFLGRGKVGEMRELAHDRAAATVIFDDALTPAQARNLENELNLRVIDRSQLILDIFALRARTLEGKLQVEIAQLSYLQPRLTRQWTHLSRQAGGAGAAGRVGTRGPGETQLEVDRRRIRERLTRLKARLRQVERTRGIQRRRRDEVPYATVALAGYTNSGKSTLMNVLTGAGIETADRPFSTLDPTIRRLKLPGNIQVMLADTVGFIHRLPHMLIDAFKATLEEVRSADLILHVVDASSPLMEERMRVVDGVLEEIGAGLQPRLIVLNKIDRTENPLRVRYETPSVAISALRGEGLDQLLAAIARNLPPRREEVALTLPSARGDLIAMARRDGEVFAEEYRDGVVDMRARVSPKVAGQLRKAAVSA